MRSPQTSSPVGAHVRLAGRRRRARREWRRGGVAPGGGPRAAAVGGRGSRTSARCVDPLACRAAHRSGEPRGLARARRVARRASASPGRARRALPLSVQRHLPVLSASRLRADSLDTGGKHVCLQAPVARASVAAFVCPRAAHHRAVAVGGWARSATAAAARTGPDRAARCNTGACHAATLSTRRTRARAQLPRARRLPRAFLLGRGASNVVSKTNTSSRASS